MTIVLGIAIISTFFADILNRMFNFQEGFKEGIENSDTSSEPELLTPTIIEKMDKERLLSELADREISTNNNMDRTELIDLLKEAVAVEAENDEQPSDNDGQTNTDPFKNKSGYQNQIPLKPSDLSIPNKESVSKQLGKADKLESAYNNLEKVIGSNGIKSMSGDTEKLIAKQGELLKQLKDLTPELNKTIDSVSKLDINGILGSFKGISKSLNNI